MQHRWRESTTRQILLLCRQKSVHQVAHPTPAIPWPPPSRRPQIATSSETKINHLAPENQTLLPYMQKTVDQVAHAATGCIQVPVRLSYPAIMLRAGCGKCWRRVNDWRIERQFAKLNKKKQPQNVKVIRSGKAREIDVQEILPRAYLGRDFFRGATRGAT